MEYKLPVVSSQTYTHQDIPVDGKRFENCRFIRCQIIYSGGPAEASACEFSPDTVWKFQGAAAMTLETLQRFGWRFSYGKGETPEPLPLV
jgi:hypothetical protein